MNIERYDGPPPFEPAPGNALFHATVQRVKRDMEYGMTYPAPFGFVFEAKPDATEAELGAIADRRWNEIRPKGGAA